jgi:RNA polymerase sigma-70 factor (sigma-E family)
MRPTALVTTGGEPTVAPDEAREAAGARTADPSFDVFFVEEFPRLVRVASLLVDSSATAEEIVQEACIRVYRRWDDLDHPAAFARTCVVNACRDRLRRRARWRVRVPLIASEDVATDVTGPDDDHEVLAVLRALSERQRTVIVLRYYDDLTPTEIAEVLGVSPASVKSLLHRALERFRQELDR